jgi:hypothetical protein
VAQSAVTGLPHEHLRFNAPVSIECWKGNGAPARENRKERALRAAVQYNVRQSDTPAEDVNREESLICLWPSEVFHKYYSKG